MDAAKPVGRLEMRPDRPHRWDAPMRKLKFQRQWSSAKGGGSYILDIKPVFCAKAMVTLGANELYETNG